MFFKFLSKNKKNFKRKKKLPKKINFNLINFVEKKVKFKLTLDQIEKTEF